MSSRIVFSGMLLFTVACVTQALNAQSTLVCSGTFEGSQTVSIAFAPGANPAPTLGAACAKKGTTAPVGKVVAGTSSVPLFLVSAVVVGAASTTGGATSGAGSAGATLVCSGTRLNGAAFTFSFAANTSPAPTLGVTCVPSGKTMPKGKAVMGTAPKASQVIAVVFFPPSTAGGANTTGAGPAGATLVCKGTRLNGTAFTFAFVANTSPAPTPGVACAPSGKTMPKGTAVMGTAPKAGTVFAVVFVPPSTAGGTPNASQPPSSSPPAATPAGTTPPVPPAIQAGIANLRNAKANLQNAGTPYGPHRVNAITDIDQALNVCGLPQTTGNGEMNSGYADIQSLMTAATSQLSQAQTEFKNAKDPWGGRRDDALTFISLALQEAKMAASAYKAP